MKRSGLLTFLIVITALVFIGRLFYLQVLASDKYQDAAISIQSRDVVTPAVRGAITDINGTPMVVDLPGLVVSINRTVLDQQFDKGTSVGGSTEAWEQFYTAAVNQEGVYLKRTSYNGNIRKEFAAVGGKYIADADVFVAPQPYSSWTLDSNHDWQPPTPKPNGDFYWSEEDLVWVAV